ncbi:MAG: hypothetical protein SGARI_003039 [Bacillariaceae sp.]
MMERGAAFQALEDELSTLDDEDTRRLQSIVDEYTETYGPDVRDWPKPWPDATDMNPAISSVVLQASAIVYSVCECNNHVVAYGNMSERTSQMDDNECPECGRTHHVVETSYPVHRNGVQANFVEVDKQLTYKLGLTSDGAFQVVYGRGMGNCRRCQCVVPSSYRCLCSESQGGRKSHRIIRSSDWQQIRPDIWSMYSAQPSQSRTLRQSERKLLLRHSPLPLKPPADRMLPLEVIESFTDHLQEPMKTAVQIIFGADVRCQRHHLAVLQLIVDKAPDSHPHEGAS